MLTFFGKYLGPIISGLIDLRKVLTLDAFKSMSQAERRSLLPLLSSVDVASAQDLTDVFRSEFVFMRASYCHCHHCVNSDIFDIWVGGFEYSTFVANLYEFQNLLRHGYFEQTYQMKLKSRRRRVNLRRDSWKDR